MKKYSFIFRAFARSCAFIRFRTRNLCAFRFSLFCLSSLLFTIPALAQRDTTALPLIHKVLEARFFRHTTAEKINILADLQKEIPDADSGKIAEEYDDLRSDIAQDYLKAGDKPSAELWLTRLHTAAGQCAGFIRAGDLLLTQDAKANAEGVKARLQPLVDSVSNQFRLNGRGKEAYSALMPVYVKALLTLDQQDRIAFYLQPLYKANGGSIPSDMRARALNKDYQLTDDLSYDYGMALAATGHPREAIDVWAHLYLTGDEATGTVKANIAAECKKIPGGEAYFKHITDSVQQYYQAKLTAFAANKKDLDGKTIDFNALKGKYVLLDFWGSWCKPCRASHPHLKELYGKYKDKGFEIVGVAEEHSASAEASRQAWTKAIEQDSLPWIQVLNNENIKGFNAVASYDITAFPTKILLDKDGNIIGRYVGNGPGSAALTNKLEELLGK